MKSKQAHSLHRSDLNHMEASQRSRRKIQPLELICIRHRIEDLCEAQIPMLHAVGRHGTTVRRLDSHTEYAIHRKIMHVRISPDRVDMPAWDSYLR